MNLIEFIYSRKYYIEESELSFKSRSNAKKSKINVTFENLFKIITSKAYRMLDFISRSLNHLKQLNTYKLLYFTYVQSNLEY